jgi:hypothetical protein
MAAIDTRRLRWTRSRSAAVGSGGRNLGARRDLRRHEGAGVAVHHEEVGVGAVEQQHPHVGICLASIEEVAERDRELAVEDVRWRMVDGDVRYMTVDGDGERPVHRRRSLMKLISHEFLLLGCWAGLVMPVVPFVPGFGSGAEGVG